MKTTLMLMPSVIDNLREETPQTMSDLGARIEIAPADFDAAAQGSLGLAQQAASLLEESYLSSDTDSPYWPCVLQGLGDDPFRAFGTASDERVTLSGWDNPRLELRDVSVVQALSNLNDDGFARINDYIGDEDQQAFAKAAKLLEAQGRTLNLRLAFPEESLKLIFTLAQCGDEYAGVVALSVET